MFAWITICCKWSPTKVTLSFDDTTKQQKNISALMLSYSNTTQPSTNPISTSIAYMRSYCKADGLHEATASINRLNDYIDFWNTNDNKQLLEQTKHCVLIRLKQE